MNLRNWFFTLKSGLLCGDSPTYVSGARVVSVRELGGGSYEVVTSQVGTFVISLHYMDRYFMSNHLPNQKEWLRKYAVAADETDKNVCDDD